MKSFVFILIMLGVVNIYGQESESENPVKKEEPSTAEKVWEKTKDYSKKAYDFTKEKAKKVHSDFSVGREVRSERDWVIMGNYSYLDLWIPGKQGITFGYRFDESATLELEYLTGEYSFAAFLIDDLGKFSDKRLSLLYRSYNKRNSFNWLYGLFYEKVEIYLGSEFLEGVTDFDPKVDLVDIQTAGITWGLGNRWQFKSGFALGVDWFVINIPLVTLNKEAAYFSSSASQKDKDKVDDTMSTIAKFPTFSVIKFQIGGSF